jgi:hypothetical protein
MALTAASVLLFLSAWGVASLFARVLSCDRVEALGAAGITVLALAFGIGLLGWSILPVVQIAWAIAAVLGLTWAARSRQLFQGWDIWALLLWMIPLAFWGWIFRDLAGLPSRDDGTQHAYYLMKILESGRVFLGQNLRGAEDLFGADPLHFYPTGAHVLTAVVGAPALLLPGVLPSVLLKAALLLVLASFPAALDWGARKLLPQSPRALSFFVALVFGLWGLFPGSPVIEGGYSRIVGLVGALPLAFTLLRRLEIPPHTLAIGLAIGLPTALLVHPETVFLLGPTLFWRFVYHRAPLAWRGLAFLGGAIGAFLVTRAYLSTGEQALLNPVFTSTLAGSSASGIWDRSKGMLHYWFADSGGFLKFFSPRSIALALGLVLGLQALRIARDGPVVLFFSLHFVFIFALNYLVFFPALDPIHLLFYRAQKRIAELGFFSHAFLVQWGLLWMGMKFPRHMLRTMGAVVGVLWVISAMAWMGREFPKWSLVYESPLQPEMRELDALLANEKRVVSLLSARYGLLLERAPDRVIFFSPECVESPWMSTGCGRRKVFFENLRSCVEGRSTCPTGEWRVLHANGDATPAPGFREVARRGAFVVLEREP